MPRPILVSVLVGVARTAMTLLRSGDNRTMDRANPANKYINPATTVGCTFARTILFNVAPIPNNKGMRWQPYIPNDESY
ncbi:hypothetical protein KEJ34_05285 [Candidatus Bathyarchaeota archaeon]|nr:hypothetical protein [Candidatus Bathyarchaeota archaeon]